MVQFISLVALCISSCIISTSFAKQCKIPGQVFTRCGGKCGPNCKYPERKSCPYICAPGCICPEGTYLDENQNKCVKKSDCTQQDVCKIPGQVFTRCKGKCGPNCKDPEIKICPYICAPGCICPEGTYLDENLNKCVKKSDCTHKDCEIPGQVFSPCKGHCGPSCKDPDNKICPAICAPGCICPEGTYLDERLKKCVEKSDCSLTKNVCKIPGQIFSRCLGDCGPTCTNPFPPCPKICKPGCICPSGTFLDEKRNICVRACPKIYAK